MNGWRGGAGALTACGVAGVADERRRRAVVAGDRDGGDGESCRERVRHVAHQFATPFYGARSHDEDRAHRRSRRARLRGRPASADVQPYGTNDAGGFRNVLPPGEAGTDNALQLALFQADGTRAAALHRPAAALRRPALRVADADARRRREVLQGRDLRRERRRRRVDRVAAPRRDRSCATSSYGVPHIYGATDDDVEFGAGYAGAEDRLFLMDVLRHTGARAAVARSSAARAGNRAMDRTQWAIAPYTEDDLQKQIDLAPTRLRRPRARARRARQRVRRRHQRLHRRRR